MLRLTVSFFVFQYRHHHCNPSLRDCIVQWLLMWCLSLVLPCIHTIPLVCPGRVLWTVPNIVFCVDIMNFSMNFTVVSWVHDKFVGLSGGIKMWFSGFDIVSATAGLLTLLALFTSIWLLLDLSLSSIFLHFWLCYPLCCSLSCICICFLLLFSAIEMY